MADDKDETRKMYHYTDKNGKEAIEKTGRIEPSKSGRYGEGVYFTTIPPEAGRKIVSQNNWDAGAQWQTAESQGRADYAIEVEMPVDKVKEKSETRDILLHDGPVVLKDHEWKVLQK